MPDMVLVRDEFTPEATFGVLTAPNFRCETVERDRDNNRASTDTRPGACIPVGVYICRRVQSPSHGECFEVTGVPGRLYIQIHAANWSRELRGCIAPGLKRAIINGTKGVTSSKKALANLMAIQKGVDRFTLTVKEV